MRALRGFTLIELVVTVALIGLLTAIAAPLAETVVQRGKEHELKSALMTMRDAIDAYKDAADSGRIAKGVGESGYPANLQVLVDGVVDKQSAGGAKLYFLRRIPRDPFASVEPGVTAAQTWGLRSSDTPPGTTSGEGGKDVYDVRSLSPGKALDGTPYQEW